MIIIFLDKKWVGVSKILDLFIAFKLGQEKSQQWEQTLFLINSSNRDLYYVSDMGLRLLCTLPHLFFITLQGGWLFWGRGNWGWVVKLLAWNSTASKLSQVWTLHLWLPGSPLLLTVVTFTKSPGFLSLHSRPGDPRAGPRQRKQCRGTTPMTSAPSGSFCEAGQPFTISLHFQAPVHTFLRAWRR